AVGKGVFLLTSFLGMAAVSVAAFLASAACLISFNLILLGGEERFGLSEHRLDSPWTFGFAFLPPLFVVSAALSVSGFRPELVAGVPSGWAAAILVIILSKLFLLKLRKKPEPGEKLPVTLIYPG